MIALIRPKSWVKNFLVFAAPLFSGSFFRLSGFVDSIIVFFGFCALASAGYIINDWLDRERDRDHPKKSDRPLASGRVSPILGLVISLVLLGSSFALISLLPYPAFLETSAIFGLYALMMTAYNLGLKHVFGLEMLIVSVGILMRAVAGGVGLQVPITNWFLYTIFFLCLMLVAGKRRHELISLGEHAADHRPVLGKYPPVLLDTWITIAASASLVTYSLWSMGDSITGFNTGNFLAYSVIFVVFGLLRYLKLIYSGEAGAPEDVFLNDLPMILCVGGWIFYISALFVT